jgi:acetoin utilization protein AcuB
MFSQDCIDSSIPFIRPADTAGFALDMMQEYKTEQLAVVSDGNFAGLISEKILMDADDGASISTLQEAFLSIAVTEGTHIFDLLKKSAENSGYHIPVINTENEYMGITSPAKILQTLTQHSSVNTSGGIIVLELETKNYSLTEISRIVESNGAMILHCMMATSVNQHLMQISLKINKNDLKDIQAAFERYHYTVLAVLHQSEYEVQLKERFDSLMKYLEV